MPRRDNGFRRDGALSLNAHQLGGASLYLGLVLGFYLLQAPAIEDATARLACEIAFASSAAPSSARRRSTPRTIRTLWRRNRGT
jgi:palmitoyltransferase